MKLAQSPDVEALQQKAAAIRRTIVEMAIRTGGGYLASGLSATDMLVAVYYGYLRGDPARPDWSARDRFVLSPGHYAMPLYAILADLGYFPQAWLWQYKADGAPLELSAHRGVPGVEWTGGSLAQGLSVGLGMAVHARLRQQPYRTFVMTSDGELDEGQTWEAAMAAHHYCLGNLTMLLDFNGFQVDGDVHVVMNPEPVAEKWQTFGWLVEEIDGHDMGAVVAALARSQEPRTQPYLILGRTVRGKGVSFLEGRVDGHYVRFTEEEAIQARADVGSQSIGGA